MPVDKNEAPHGYEAVESTVGSCKGCHIGNNPHTCPKNHVDPITVFCGALNRKDKTSVIFIKKERLEKTMEEHQYLTAEEEYQYLTTDTAENCAEIFKWKKAGRVEIYDAPRWLLSAHFGLHFGQKYRRKKPAQDVLLTDEHEIARGILSGVVQFRVKNTQTDWMTGFFAEHVKTNLERGYEYRIKPGCVLPPKKVKKLVDRTAEDFWPLIGIWWIRHKNTGHRGLMIKDHYPDQSGIEIAPPGGTWQPMQKEIEVEG
jgi:hypothetical protein